MIHPVKSTGADAGRGAIAASFLLLIVAPTNILMQWIWDFAFPGVAMMNRETGRA
jgi:hypothetical protein